MKFILISLQNIKRDFELKEYSIDETRCINELVLGYSGLTKLLKKKPGIIKRIKTNIYEKKLKNVLYKTLDLKKSLNEKWYYILSREVYKDDSNTKYIINKLENLGGTKYVPLSEMNSNILKYISEYTKSKNIIPHELKVLFVYKCLKNINFDTIQKCISEYKKVNIYSTEKPSYLILDNISKINKQEGCGIEVIKYNKKAFLEYDVIYFTDDLRTNHPRMRINKNALVIDENDAICDKYNSNVVFFNDIRNNIEWSNKLNEQYGLLNIAAVVRKIAN